MSTRKETKSELGAALKEAARAPSQQLYTDELWSRLEDLAAKEQRPDEVGELYRKVVREAGKPDLVAAIAPRAVRFHEEWFGAQADELAEILTRVLEVDPGAEWALRRLSVLYTVKERWNDLLALYDRSLAAVDDIAHRRELLTEAVRVAKDFVGDTDRTIGYLGELQRLSPGDAHLAGQLERLLERQAQAGDVNRWAELASLWRARVAALPPGEARALRGRTASLLLERLNDPVAALAEIRPLLLDPEAGDAGTPIAEKILRLPAAPPEARGAALGLLRERYQASGRHDLIVAALQVALDFARPGDRAMLHREIGERLATAGDRKSAMEHLSVQLGLSPGDDEVLERLRQLSESEGDPAAYVRGLDAAASATPDSLRKVALWLEAARIHDEHQGDPRAAIAYYRQAFRESGADPASRLEAARKLVDRLGQTPDAAETPGERLIVLEALAAELGTAAPQSGERRAALVEAAQAAEERGDWIGRRRRLPSCWRPIRAIGPPWTGWWRCWNEPASGTRWWWPCAGGWPGQGPSWRSGRTSPGWRRSRRASWPSRRPPSTPGWRSSGRSASLASSTARSPRPSPTFTSAPSAGAIWPSCWPGPASKRRPGWACGCVAWATPTGNGWPIPSGRWTATPGPCRSARPIRRPSPGPRHCWTFPARGPRRPRRWPGPWRPRATGRACCRWWRSGCRPRPMTAPGCACCPRRPSWPSVGPVIPRRP